MLCEKCGRRQAEWGTLCRKCEEKHAQADRQKDVVCIVNRLKWFALWMVGDVVLVGVVGTVLLCASNNALSWMSLALLVAEALALAVSLREWQMWHFCASRLKNGEYRQVAEKILHHPRGFWKMELRHPFLNVRRRRRRIPSGMLFYLYELSNLKNELLMLEALLKDE